MACVASPGSLQQFNVTTCNVKYYGHSSLCDDHNLTRTTGHLSVATETSKLSAVDHVDNPSITHRKSAFRDKERGQAENQDTGFGKKNVHFDDTFEHSRFFRSVDAPMALATDLNSTKQRELSGFGCISTINIQRRFCFLNSPLGSPSVCQPIQLKTLELSPSGKQIKGTVIVQNLGFQKEVVVRFTFDDWKTVSEVAAKHGQSLYLGHSIVSDKFVFLIDRESFPLQIGNIIRVCARYNVLDNEFWDNNGGRDYSVALSIPMIVQRRPRQKGE